MPRIGRAKYHSVNLKSNTGRGGVVSSSGFMGRGLVIRRAITRSSLGKCREVHKDFIMGILKKRGKYLN